MFFPEQEQSLTFSYAREDNENLASNCGRKPADISGPAQPWPLTLRGKTIWLKVLTEGEYIWQRQHASAGTKCWISNCETHPSDTIRVHWRGQRAPGAVNPSFLASCVKGQLLATRLVTQLATFLTAFTVYWMKLLLKSSGPQWNVCTIFLSLLSTHTKYSHQSTYIHTNAPIQQ